MDSPRQLPLPVVSDVGAAIQRLLDHGFAMVVCCSGHYAIHRTVTGSSVAAGDARALLAFVDKLEEQPQ
jgi:hypothetical protein